MAWTTFIGDYVKESIDVKAEKTSSKNVLIIVGVSGGQGRNFEIAADTEKRKHSKDSVVIIKAQDIVDGINNKKYKKGEGLDNLIDQIDNAFGTNGIDKLVYFGHSHQKGLSVFKDEDLNVVGEKIHLTEEHIKDGFFWPKYNTNAQILLMGCRAGEGANSLAQKIANNFNAKLNIKVFGFTSYSLATTDSNRINKKEKVTEKELKAKFGPNTPALYYFGQDGKGLKKFTK